MRVMPAVLLTCFCSFAVLADEADFRAEVQQLAQKFETLLPAAQSKMDAGDFAGANATLLNAFPKANQSAAQSFILGNLLFDIDQKQSYALHKTAATLAPQNPTIIWEWALEQHRAGEYAGALASYEIFAKANPGQAVTYALQADCLLHLNKIDQAAAAWKKSEDAPDGSIEGMEDMVCTVHRPPAPHARRAELLAKATQQHDAKAAGDLIALDCQFTIDWWNAPPRKAYLAHDVPAVMEALKLKADDNLNRSILCARECALADRSDKAAIRALLEKHKLLIDADNTLPANSELQAVILSFAATSENVDTGLRKKLGPKILILAQQGHDVQLWNDAAFMKAQGTAEEDMKLEHDGWQATGDPRFAATYLHMKAKHLELKLDDPDLVAARKQFPDSSMVQRIAYETALTHNQVTRELLAEAARAEFTHFSSFIAPATVVNRPRSNYLRQYFASLMNMPAKTPAAQEK